MRQKNSAIFIWLVVFAVLGFGLNRASAAPLLWETFNSGDFSANFSNNIGTSYTLIDLGGGDLACRMTGNASNYTGILSNSSFSRGGNLRCTFRLWNER